MGSFPSGTTFVSQSTPACLALSVEVLDQNARAEEQENMTKKNSYSKVATSPPRDDEAKTYVDNYRGEEPGYEGLQNQIEELRVELQSQMNTTTNSLQNQIEELRVEMRVELQSQMNTTTNSLQNQIEELRVEMNTTTNSIQAEMHRMNTMQTDMMTKFNNITRLLQERNNNERYCPPSFHVSFCCFVSARQNAHVAYIYQM